MATVPLTDDPLDRLATRLRDELVADAGSAGVSLASGGALQRRIRTLVDREASLLDGATREELVRRIEERSFGLGALEPLLADPEVDEIMVSGTEPVWIERRGRLERTGVAFASEEDLRHAIERVLAPLGRRVDEAEPMCDARLPDTTRCAPQWYRRVMAEPSIRDLPRVLSPADQPKPIDAYVRVSRVGDRSGESYISPDVQKRAIEKWAEETGATLRWHEPEENVSGGTMDRPIFNEVMRAIRSGESGGVVVYTLDRFSRTLLGGLIALNEITDHGAIFASASEPAFDFSRGENVMFLQIQLVMAEYFRKRIKDSWKDTITNAVGRGVHIAPGVPYGYSKDESKRYVPNEGARFVAEAFKRRAAGQTYQAIADWLNEAAPARADGNEWTWRSVEAVIKRKTYLGIAFSGDVENQKAHDALTDRATWERAQQKVQTYSKASTMEDVALLHGLVRCAGCRYLMSRQNNKSGGYERPYYRCRVHRQSGTCPNPASVRADREDGLEAYVENIFMDELERRHRTISEVADDSLADAIEDRDMAIQDLEEFKADTTARRLLGETWTETLAHYLDAVDAAQTKVSALEAQAGLGERLPTRAEYDAMPREQRVPVLRSLIDAVFVRRVGGPRGNKTVALSPERVWILWRGEGPADLPQPGKRAESVSSWLWPA